MVRHVNNFVQSYFKKILHQLPVDHSPLPSAAE
jgi:hypothetical protein